MDTDPENMLSEDEPVRLFHDRPKRTSSSDMVVVGVVNDAHSDGVFNPDVIAQHLRPDGICEDACAARPSGRPEPAIGVVEVDLLAPSTVDTSARAVPAS
jgi:uncharacterized protein